MSRRLLQTMESHSQRHFLSDLISWAISVGFFLVTRIQAVTLMKDRSDPSLHHCSWYHNEIHYQSRLSALFEIILSAEWGGTNTAGLWEWSVWCWRIIGQWLHLVEELCTTEFNVHQFILRNKVSSSVGSVVVLCAHWSLCCFSPRSR